jgi:hypothetical protein
MPAAAHGAVRIDARTAVVKTAAGAAIVYRSPFRIVFTDARGEVVLSEARARAGDLHIGGYFDLYTPRPTTKELLLRWAELAVFTPFFRLHGSLLAGTHTPWRYDRQTVHIYDGLAALHQREVPLILRLWREAQRTGIPPPDLCGSPIPAIAARRDRTRSGCSARTCWSPRWSPRAPVAAASTSPQDAGARR